MKVCRHTVFNIKKKITLNYPKSAAKKFFQGTPERVRNSHGERAISVRATEVLLYSSIVKSVMHVMLTLLVMMSSI